MIQNSTSISRPAIAKLFIGAVLLLGLLGLFVALAGDASAGGDTKITVNSTANIDDGECEGAPNDDEIGNCTLHEAIDMVNNGDADIINFHKPVFSKEQPGVISLCEDDGEGDLPLIERDIMIDSKNSGVIIDGGNKDEDCADPAEYGLLSEGFSDGFDFELNGGKNFDIRNVSVDGIRVCGGDCGTGESLGTIAITGVFIDNVDNRGIWIAGSNLESGSVTNSEISSDFDAVNIEVNACAGSDCELDDSTVDISGNRIVGGADAEEAGRAAGVGPFANGVDILYTGVLNSPVQPAGGGNKITVSVSQNEVINGADFGVVFDFFGCGVDSGINVHIDENDEINGMTGDAVNVIVGGQCATEAGSQVAGVICCPEETSANFTATVTVNGNGDIENHRGLDQDGVDVRVTICCEESDSSAIVEVNGNGRITGEDDGVHIETEVCCGDDNSSDISVNGNDEVTGEGDDGIEVIGFAGSDSALVAGAAGSPTGFDADDNTCTITIDGNNEIDGVGSGGGGGIGGNTQVFANGIDAECFAGTRDGGMTQVDPPTLIAGATSSGDGNTSTIIITNNNDIDGDEDGIAAVAIAGSTDGEADDNLTEVVVSGNGEITGDDGDGISIDTSSGTAVEEGDDNASIVTIEENNEIGGNGSDGIDVDSFAGGVTVGSEDDTTEVTIVQNGSIEGSGEGDDGIELDSTVCCDPANTNLIQIMNNKDEITGHDGGGISIETCCSVNTITVMDNDGNIRGGDDNGLELSICGSAGFGFSEASGFGTVANIDPDQVECWLDALTNLTVMNNSFSDSEADGINIIAGTFEDEDLDFKSVISNNVIEGNGGDGIDIESASGLNIGPDNEIFENGTGDGDNGVEIDWFFGACIWPKTTEKFSANHNTITQNSIYDNAGLGIDLVGWDSDDGCEREEDGSVVGCVPFPNTPITPNDCLPFPELQTQSGDKLIGIACSECIVEVFWADDDPSNNDDADGVPHGEGAVYLVSGEADEDGSLSIDLPCDLGPGELTATATDKLKNTSEFSANLITLGTSGCATDTPLPTDTPVPTNTPAETDTPAPTNTPVPTNTPEPPKVCGDVNEDGVANSVDASLVLQLKAGLISSLPNESSGDVNGDGSLTSVDAALLLQFTAGLIDEDALNCG